MRGHGGSQNVDHAVLEVDEHPVSRIGETWAPRRGPSPDHWLLKPLESGSLFDAGRRIRIRSPREVANGLDS